MNKHTKKQIWIWVFVLIGVLFLRYQYFTDVFTQAGFMAANTDTYYRLHRIETIVNQPGFFNFSYPLTDSLLNFPGSWNVAWPLGLDLLFAIPLKWMGIHDVVGISFFIFLMIPLLVLPIVFVTASIIRRYAGASMGILGGALIGVMPVVIMNTSLGNLDHHGIEILMMLLGFYLIEKIEHHEGKYSVVLLGLLLGISPSIDPHAWLVCPMICAALLLERNPDYLLRVAKSFLGGFILSVICLAFSNRFYSGYISISGFSWWASIVIFSSCVFIKLLILMRTQTNRTKFVIVGVAILLLLILPSILVLGIRNELQAGINWLFLKTGTIGQTMESVSLFRYPLSQWGEAWLIVLAPLMMGWLIYRKKCNSLVLYAVIPVLFSFFQVRFIGMASPLCVILFVLFLHDMGGIFSVQRTKKIFYGCLTAILVFCFYPNLVFKPRATDLIHSYFFPVRDASKFLKIYTHDNPSVGQDDFKPAVIAPWDFGHWILFFSELPVVAHPFQGASALRVNDLLISDSPETFADFQKEIPARFLLIEQSIPRYFSAMQYIGKDVNGYFSTTLDQGVRKIAESKNIEKTFYHRFLFDLGATPEDGFPDHWRWMYVSPYAAADIATLPALKVFEHVKSVKVQFKTDQNNLYIKGVVQDQNHQFILSKPGKKIDAQTVEWNIPYGEYNHGGVFCDGNFVIADSRNKIIKRLPKISNQQVIDGDSVIVR